MGWQRYIVQPRLEGWIEELLPGVSHMDNQAATEEQVLQPKTGGHPPVVEEHLILAVLLKAGLFSRGLSKCVSITLPTLVLGVLGINQSRTFAAEKNQGVPLSTCPATSKESLA